ncbi:uncharacterized protein LOC117172731 [Belonocnema kinseyi]|uniref:uncharacterized protein LOC117172731 n=1 Tax=Belonocnema kinseyi TaxID=2817044 RepID=UPI00143D7EFE|nr:uncharacterized protein LOC117172731 [Belonocnema kinseyi]
MKFLIFIFVICFSTQARARPTPDDVIQEFLDSIRRRVSDALSQVQEMAHRAIESAKSAVLNSLQSAQNSAKQGIEVGQSFVKLGENSARKFIEETAKAVPRSDNPFEQNTSTEINSGKIPQVQILTEEIPEIQYHEGPVPFSSENLPFGFTPSQTINFT